MSVDDGGIEALARRLYLDACVANYRRTGAVLAPFDHQSDQVRDSWRRGAKVYQERLAVVLREHERITQNSS